MKKVVLAAVLSTVAVSSFAEGPAYSAAGCGLGAQIFEGQSGVGPHVMAATTNGFYGTQTFAMSSGTLGCDVDQPIKSNVAAFYIDGNLDNIAASIAVGEGEALDTLAVVMGVSQSDRPAFDQALSENFATLVNAETTSRSFITAMNALLSADSSLSKYAV